MSDVCLSVAYIGPKSRTERPRKTKIGTDRPRHTWFRHHFQGQKGKGQGHQATFLSAALTRKAAAAVKVKRSKVILQGGGVIVAGYRTACIRMRQHNNIHSRPTLCTGKRHPYIFSQIFSKCGSKLHDFWQLSCNEISFKWLTNPKLCDCTTLWFRTTQTVAEHCLDLFHKVVQSHGLGLVSHFKAVS